MLLGDIAEDAHASHKVNGDLLSFPPLWEWPLLGQIYWQDLPTSSLDLLLPHLSFMLLLLLLLLAVLKEKAVVVFSVE